MAKSTEAAAEADEQANRAGRPSPKERIARGKAARAKVHPAAEVVDRAEAEQRPAELVLAVERGAGGPLRQHAPELTAHVPVEGRVRRDLPADAEPVHPHRAHLRRQLADLAPDLAVLSRHRPGEHSREHRRRGSEAEHDENERPAPPAQPRAREPEGEPELAHHGGERCQRRALPVHPNVDLVELLRVPGSRFGGGENADDFQAEARVEGGVPDEQRIDRRAVGGDSVDVRGVRPADEPLGAPEDDFAHAGRGRQAQRNAAGGAGLVRERQVDLVARPAHSHAARPEPTATATENTARKTTTPTRSLIV